MSPLWVLVPTTLAMLAAWSCWCERLRRDVYQDWMIEESIRADKAESRAAWRMLTHAERRAVERAIRECEATAGLCSEQPAIDAAQRDAATLRALLERHAP